ncbi:MAG: hypothetical protein AABY18_02140 [Candidatus Thermoplasmatota archaeon]
MVRSPNLLALGLCLAAFLLAPSGMAQPADEGCDSSTPCPLTVEVDENGLYAVDSVVYGSAGAATHLDFTAGEWYTLVVDSMDAGAAHAVTLSGHPVSVTVQPDDSAESNAFQFSSAGTYKLRDAPSGDEFEIRVVSGDSLASPSTTEGAGAPGLAPGLALVALVAVAILRRR